MPATNGANFHAVAAALWSSEEIALTLGANGT